MSVIVVIDPMVGLLAGTTWFGEHIAATPTSLAGAVTAAVAVVVGVVLGHTGPAAPRPAEHRVDRPGSTSRPEPAPASVGGRARP